VYIEKNIKYIIHYSFIEIQSICTVKHNILLPNNNVLHVSVHQKQHQASSLYKFKTYVRMHYAIYSYCDLTNIQLFIKK